MQKRIIFLVLLSMGVILVTLWVISTLSISASIDRSLENRLALANIIGKYVDSVLENNLKRLYDVSLSGRVDFEDGDWDPEKKALKAAYEYSIFSDRIFLLDRGGNVIIAYPHREEERENLSAVPFVRKTLSDLRPVISDVCTVRPTQKKVIYALVPLKDKNGEVVGAAGGEIDPTNHLLTQVIKTIPAEEGTSIELMDSRGVIIASNDPRRILTCGEQSKYLSALISERKASVVSCHSCKERTPNGRKEKDMLAFAPLSMASWGISVRDPRGKAFAPSRSLRKGFLALSLISVVTALLLAVGLSRSLVRPIHSLIGATHRLARGNLRDPIEVSTADEIGTLGRSVDAMRIRLADSLESVQRYSVGLEQRVAERTRELQESREKLSILLREIITAEEEERKRIARELHDDTTQSINAALISLDSVILRFPDYDPVRKQLKQIREQCLAMLKGVHRLIKDLRPPVLDDLGLVSAVRWVLEKHMGEKGIPFHLVTAGSAEELRSRAGEGLDYGRIELVLFRVVQEAITNVSKHAEARSVAVSLSFGDGRIDVEVEDDGRGFDPVEVSRSVREGSGKGLGLAGMEERVALLDGTVSVLSSPGGGTRVRVSVPIATRTGQPSPG